MENQKRKAVEENEINKKSLEEFERQQQVLQEKIDKMTRLILNESSEKTKSTPTSKVSTHSQV